MPLESLTDSGEEELNITAFTLGEPHTKKLAFSCGELGEITEEEWEVMVAVLENARRAGNWYSYIKAAARLRMLCPSRWMELLIESSLPKVKTYLSSVRQEERKLFEWSIGLSNVVLCVPERRSEFVSDADWPHLLECWGEYRRQPSPLWSCVGIACKVLFPERVSELHLDQQGNLDQLMARIDRERTMEYWGDFALAAAELKMLYPEHVPALGMTNKGVEGERLWEMLQGSVKHRLEHLSEKEWEEYIPSRYWALKVLAAHDIRFSRTGVELVMTPSFDSLPQSLPPLPTLRSF